MEELANIFFTSLKEMMEQMGGIAIEKAVQDNLGNSDVKSYGLSSIITFAGKIKGRLLIDMEPQVGLKMAANIYGQDFDDVRDPLVLAAISELNNTVAGDANTLINDKLALGLRLAPPIVFTGRNVSISIPKISSQSIECISPYGRVKLNVAFEGGKK